MRSFKLHSITSDTSPGKYKAAKVPLPPSCIHNMNEMTSSSNAATGRPEFPPFPTPGPPEDSALAQQNFAERERASQSWLRRILVSRNVTAVPFRRIHRKSVATASSVENLTTLDSERNNVQPVSEPDNARDIGATTLPVATDRTNISQEFEKIYIKDDYINDPRRDEHLYRWAMIYENQRG